MDGQGGSSRIIRVSGDNVRLENLIFRNANVDSYGAGVYSAGSNLTIINCEFINNKGINGGLILHEDSTNALIENHVFINNAAAYFDTNGGDGAGGAIDSHSSNGRIINCTFTNNSINKITQVKYIKGSNSPEQKNKPSNIPKKSKLSYYEALNIAKTFSGCAGDSPIETYKKYNAYIKKKGNLHWKFGIYGKKI